MNQVNAVRPELGHSMNPRNYPGPPASYMGSYPAMPGIQHPIVYPRGIASPRPVSTSLGSVSPAGGNNNYSSSGASKSSNGQIEGCYYLFFICVCCAYITCLHLYEHIIGLFPCLSLEREMLVPLVIEFIFIILIFLRTTWCQFIYLSHTSRIRRPRACKCISTIW